MYTLRLIKLDKLRNSCDRLHDNEKKPRCVQTKFNVQNKIFNTK